jgi:hypothetical protein
MHGARFVRIVEIAAAVELQVATIGIVRLIWYAVAANHGTHAAVATADITIVIGIHVVITGGTVATQDVAIDHGVGHAAVSRFR